MTAFASFIPSLLATVGHLLPFKKKINFRVATLLVLRHWSRDWNAPMLLDGLNEGFHEAYFCVKI